MESDIFFRGFWIFRNEGSGGVEFTARPLAIVEVVVARFAAHGGSATNLVEIPLAGFVPGRLAPFDAFPLERLAMAALRTCECPLALVGHLELPMGVVVFLAALRHEDALAKPAECSDAGLGFGHVSLRPAPCFITDQPADRTTLKVRLVERHAVGELDRVVLALVAVNAGRHEPCDRLALIEELLQARLGIIAGILVGLIEPEGGPRQVGNDVAQRQLRGGGLRRLDGCDDRDQSNARIHQRFHDLANPRRVF